MRPALARFVIARQAVDEAREAEYTPQVSHP